MFPAFQLRYTLLTVVPTTTALGRLATVLVKSQLEKARVGAKRITVLYPLSMHV